MALYFAYGSNMDSAQMRSRVPDARPLGRVRLAGYRFRCNKIGRDGSAKANVEVAVGHEVWGVLFELSDEGLVALDRYEGGYRRAEATVWREEAPVAGVHVYVSTRTSAELWPTRAYRERMIRGALEHELPEACLGTLRALRVVD